jgi:hypothetical protein
MFGGERRKKKSYRNPKQKGQKGGGPYLRPRNHIGITIVKAWKIRRHYYLTKTGD